MASREQVERMWDEEIERRAEDLRTGRVRGLSMEEVLASVAHLLSDDDEPDSTDRSAT
jgi:hypothetical protein